MYTIVNNEKDKPKDLTWYITAGGWVCFNHGNRTHAIDYVELLNQRWSDSRVIYRYLTETEIGLIGINQDKIKQDFGVAISIYEG